MPNGILDCTNLTTGDRLGLRPGAVSLVQKAEKLQPEVTQQVIDLEPESDAPTKYARVKLKGYPIYPIQRELATAGIDDASDF
jgi:hypothetical protein